MLSQKLECPLPGMGRRFRLVVAPLIAVESMTCIVDKQGQVRMSLLDRRDLRRRYVRIARAEMHHHRTTRSLGRMRGNSSAVIADGDGGIEARGREPGEGPAETVTKYSDSHVAERTARMADRGGNVFQCCVQTNLHGRGHASPHICRFVGQFEIALGAIEQRRSNDVEPLGGVIFGDSAYVPVYSEDFLDKNNRGLLRPAVSGNIGIELVPIGSSQTDV